MQTGTGSKFTSRKSSSVTGRSAPLGATAERGGVNFSLYSRTSTRLELLLFDSEDEPPSRIIRFHPADDRVYHYWNVFVPGLQPGQLYGYRAHGPFDPVQGLRFDPSKVLLDPYGRGVVVPKGYNRDAARDGANLLLHLAALKWWIAGSDQWGRSLMRLNLCPGYFQRDDQEIIERDGPDSAKFYCALCGKEVKPVYKDGGWVPRNHHAYAGSDWVDRL